MTIYWGRVGFGGCICGAAAYAPSFFISDKCGVI